MQREQFSAKKRRRFGRQGLSKPSSFLGTTFFSLHPALRSYIEKNSEATRILSMRFLPVFLDLTSGVVALVGSGEPALSKLRLLRAAGAHVRWFSRDVDGAGEMLEPAGFGSGRLEVSFGDPLTMELAGIVAVVSAAGPAVDQKI